MTLSGMLRAISSRSTCTRLKLSCSRDCWAMTQVTGGSTMPSRPAQSALTTMHQKTTATDHRKNVRTPMMPQKNGAAGEPGSDHALARSMVRW